MKTVKTISKERMYQVILSPVVTEKSYNADENKYSFNVALDATKPEIKAAIEGIFEVEVDKVNTLVTKGKVKRFRGFLGKRNDNKKAVVTLKKGQSINLATGA